MVDKATAELMITLNAQIQQLAKIPFDKSRAKQLVRDLTDTNIIEMADFHAARQVAWAIQEVAAEHMGTSLDATQKLFFGPKGNDVLLLRVPKAENKDVVQKLGRILEAAENYDRDWFKSTLQQLHQRIQK